MTKKNFSPNNIENQHDFHRNNIKYTDSIFLFKTIIFEKKNVEYEYIHDLLLLTYLLACRSITLDKR